MHIVVKAIGLLPIACYSTVTIIPSALMHLLQGGPMDTMLAAVLHDFNDLRLEEVPRPRAVETGDVVVRIKSCGICATDYKAIRGIRRNVDFPFIPGHEPSGVVYEVGPGVKHSKPGDEVIGMPTGCCGLCRHCRTGNMHYCENGFTTGGDG